MEIGGASGAFNQPNNQPQVHQPNQPDPERDTEGLPDEVDLEDRHDPPERQQDMDRDLFLQLLVTQMQNQDPMNEDDQMEGFIQQMTMFTMVESIIDLQDAMEEFIDEQSAAGESNTALSLLNTQVVVQDEDAEGEEITIEGVVTSVDMSSERPRVTIMDENEESREYSLDDLVKAKGGFA